MQALRLITRQSVRTAKATPPAAVRCVRTLSTVPSSSATSPEHQRPVPWFVDPTDLPHAGPSTSTQTPLGRPQDAPPLPADLPPTHPIAALHAQLLASPHLEHAFLSVREPVPTEPGPPLPDAPPRGRRKRGRTYAGEGVGDVGVGLWRWIVVAQVKEGSENRGAIEFVARVVRKSLLSADPPLPLAQKRRRPATDGWLMVDAGEFAVHIVSRAARERFFPDRRIFVS